MNREQWREHRLGEPIDPNVEQAEQAMRTRLGASPDLVYRRYTTGFHGRRKGLLVYIDGLADGKAVHEVLASVIRYANPPFDHPDAGQGLLQEFAATVLQAPQQRISQDLTAASQAVLSGETALFLDGDPAALIIDTRHHPGRAVDEPKVEAEVRGPRDGLVETLRINTVLLRRRIRDPRLRFDRLVVGKRTQTDIAVAYIEGLADAAVVAEVKERVGRIEIDGVLESSYIEEFITDNPLSPFGFLFATERPDRIAGALLEGRVAILTDNTPFALVVPTTFWQFLQAPGDYYQSFWFSSPMRIIRSGALFMALVLPSLYLILTTFHHEMIPTPLALTIAGGREDTPFPTIIEVLMMEVMFEVMHEAGLRLPRAVGQTVSIVGALVIGQAAVEAGLVSPSTVIVIAISGITGFAVPVYSASLAIRMLRIPLLLLSGVLGVFGFAAGTAALALHLASLRSFGAPYLGPLVPLTVPEQKDMAVRAPWWAMVRRPRTGREARTDRGGRNQMPRPPKQGGGGGP